MRISAPGQLFALSLLALAAGCESEKPRIDEDRQIEIHTESAAGYINMGEYERAIDQAMRGLELDPDNFTLRLYLGRALLMRGGTRDVLQAESIFQQLDGTADYRVPLSLGEALERKGVAFDEASRGVATGEVFSPAPDPLVRAEELRQEALTCWNAALEKYDAANRLQPNEREVVNGLVRVTSLLGRDEESLAWADALLATTLTDRAFWEQNLQRTDVSVTEEDYSRASLRRISDLEEAVLLQAATISVRLGRPEAAVGYLERVIAVAPDLAQAHSRRAQLLIELGSYEEALAAIDNFLRLTDLEFDHPHVRKAFELRRACEVALAEEDAARVGN